MKQKILLFTTSAALAFLTLSSNENGPAHGGEGNRTGGPGASGSCGASNCHSGGTGTTTGTVEIRKKSAGLSSAPVTSYEGFVDYYVTVTGTNSALSHFGFQLDALNTANTNAGTFSNFPAQVYSATVGGKTLIEHSSPIGKTGGVYTVTFEWKAPQSGAGKVTFYGCLNAVNNDGQKTGDQPGTPFSVALTESPSSVNQVVQNINIATYPNPFRSSLNLTMENAGTGTYNITAYDLRGKQVYNEDVRYNGGTFTTAINTYKWAAGTYFVQIAKDDFKQVVPVVKQ